jgi:hypothetical protein
MSHLERLCDFFKDIELAISDVCFAVERAVGVATDEDPDGLCLRAWALGLDIGAARETFDQLLKFKNEQLVTLNQAAAIAGMSKRTLEKKKGLPEPAIKSGKQKGTARLWRWQEMRLFLQQITGRKMPEIFPTHV